MESRRSLAWGEWGLMVAAPAMTSPAPEIHFVREEVRMSARGRISTLRGPTDESSRMRGVREKRQASEMRARSGVRRRGLVGISVKTPANSPKRMRWRASSKDSPFASFR